MFFFWSSPQGSCRSSLFRLEKRDGGPSRHLYSIPDPGQLLRSLHILHHVHGHVEKRLAGHGGASHHNSGSHHLLICLQVWFCWKPCYVSTVNKKLREQMLKSVQIQLCWIIINALCCSYTTAVLINVKSFIFIFLVFMFIFINFLLNKI